jgi:MFS family permease
MSVTPSPAGGPKQAPGPPGGPPTRVRYGVLAFACALSMITYLDRVCFGLIGSDYIQPEFGLSDDQLGYLFSAFALAYAAFEVPSGWLGDVYGPKRTLIRIVLWWSAFTALTGTIHPTPSAPLVAFLLLLAVRFLFGMGEAGAYPNIARSFHNWFPFRERGSAQGAVWMAGRLAGGVTPFVVLALVYHTQGPDGPVAHWRHTFYVFGVLGVAWCVAFWWWFRDRPEQHAAVGPEELAYIRAGRTAADEQGHGGVPWRRLLGSANLWALCLMYFCGAYGWYFNITFLPKYLKETYGISPESPWTMSLLIGAPLLLGSLACLFGGLLTDWFIRRTGDRKWGRRLFGVVGHGTCALFYVLALLVHIFHLSPWLFVGSIALAAFWNDLTMGAAWASCIDIGKRYSGIVSGCMNTVGNMGGAVAGALGGLVLTWLKPFPGLGWSVNLASFAFVYVAAVGLWLMFDATRPLVDDGDVPPHPAWAAAHTEEVVPEVADEGAGRPYDEGDGAIKT